MFAKMACADFVAKYLLFCVNFVVTLISLITICLGALLLYFSNATNNAVPALYIIPVVIIIAGCLVFVIGSFGCCGTIAEKSCPLVTYSICMILLFAGNVYLSVLFLGNMEAVVTVVENELENTFDNSETRGMFFVLEGLFKCCGTTGPEAYVDRNLTISITCCPNPTFGNVTIDDITDIESITDIGTNMQFCAQEDSYGGCTDILVGFVNSFTNGIYFFIVALIVTQTVGIIAGFYLAYEFRSKDKITEVLTYSRY